MIFDEFHKFVMKFTNAKNNFSKNVSYNGHITHVVYKLNYDRFLPIEREMERPMADHRE